MRDRDPKKLNKDDLAEVKSLIGDAEPGSFTLEDILAEYGGRKGPRRSAVPVFVRPQGSCRDGEAERALLEQLVEQSVRQNQSLVDLLGAVNALTAALLAKL